MTRVIGTAGHVDHGKSTLVTALTGIDPDRLVEEKARQMTIDLGFAWLTLPGGESVGIVDVPGHRDFIENMLAGVGGIDLALLVIAADEGIMPQTREHLAILDLLGIPAGVVALTKIDTITDADWLELVRSDIAATLAGTALEGAPIVPVSARTGQGLEALVATLEQALAGCPPRADRGRPRLPVDRVFSMSGFGTVVTGTLSDGTLAVGEEVEILPSGRRARIRGLQSHKQSIPVAQPGSRVAVNLSGVDKDDLQRGDVLARPGALQATRLVDVRLRTLAAAPHPLAHNAQVKLFCGAAERLAHVRLLGDRELAPGADGWLQLRLDAPIALERGDRFILRYPSPAQTLGGGIIVDAHPEHRWRRFKPEVLARLERLAQGSPEDVLLQSLEGQAALLLADTAAQAGLAPDEAARLIADLQARGDVLALPEGWIIARAAWTRLLDGLRRELQAYHQAKPLRPGIPREELRSRLGLDAKAYPHFLSAAEAAGEVAADGATVSLPGHAIHFSATQQQAVARLMEAIHSNPAAPPSIKEAAAMVGDDVLQALFDLGTLVQAGPDVLFEAQAYARLVAEVKALIREQGPVTVALARDRLNTSRKYVLALLEHLDEVGITRRVGDERVLR